MPRRLSTCASTRLARRTECREDRRGTANSQRSRPRTMVRRVARIVMPWPVVVCCVNQSRTFGDSSQTPRTTRISISHSSYPGVAHTLALMSRWDWRWRKPSTSSRPGPDGGGVRHSTCRRESMWHSSIFPPPYPMRSPNKVSCNQSLHSFAGRRT